MDVGVANPPAGGIVPEGYEWDYEGHRRRQARRGLAMTPAERLRWLEETTEEMRKLLGRARGAPTVGTGGPKPR